MSRRSRTRGAAAADPDPTIPTEYAVALARLLLTPHLPSCPIELSDRAIWRTECDLGAAIQERADRWIAAWQEGIRRQVTCPEVEVRLPYDEAVLDTARTVTGTRDGETITAPLVIAQTELRLQLSTAWPDTPVEWP